MTALPNHTCFSVIETFGVELPFEVAIVDVVEFKMPDVDKYSRCGVIVNGCHCNLLVKMADLTGSWKKIGMARSDAKRRAQLINDKAEKFSRVRSGLQSMTRKVGKRDVKLTLDQILKLVREYNGIIDFFETYNIDLSKKLEYDFETKSVIIARS